MSNVRIIPRLDIKGPNLIKSIHLEGLRVIGNPSEYAFRYYLQGADELILMDCVASLYGRNNLSDHIRVAAKNIFVPITVGGGIRSLVDAIDILRAGADKVALNTAAVANPKLINEVAKHLGSQCVVLSVEAKNVGPNQWLAYTHNGREPTNLNVIDWIKKGIDMGVGEILLTSIDQEGTRKGFDLNLLRSVSKVASVPLIISGGMGKPEDLFAAVECGANGIAMADILHYNRLTIADIRLESEKKGLGVRNYAYP